MSSIGNFGQNAQFHGNNLQFQGAIAHALNGCSPSMGATLVRATLDHADQSKLSPQEKNVLVSMTHVLAADGEISDTDAQAITSMIHSSESNSRGANAPLGGNHAAAGNQGLPAAGGRKTGGNNGTQLPTQNAAKNGGGADGAGAPKSHAKSSPLFGQVADHFANKLGQGFKDAMFSDTAKNMLDTTKDSRPQQSVAKAFDAADLSKLTQAERTKALKMLGHAAGDGHISKAESKAIRNFLDHAQGVRPQANAWKVTNEGDGKASIDLGKYTLDVDESNSQFILTNKATGEKTQIWGDPHMVVDGKPVGDFKGTMTLNLDDGTKITIHTTPFSANNQVTLSRELTITKGDKAMDISGLDQNTLGDLKISKVPHGGQSVDAMTNDGTDIYENPEGGGWLQLAQSGELQDVDGNFLKTV